MISPAAARASAARLALVLLPALASGCGGAPESPGELEPARPGLEAYFEESTAAVGLGRRGLSFGMAVGDVDGDGREDVVLSNHGIPTLHLNRAGRFERPSESYFPKLPRADRHLPILVDLDDDGWLDLVLTHGADDGRGHKQNEVLRQTAEGFRPAADTGLEDPLGRSRAAALFDADNDGRVDFLLANALRGDALNKLYLNRGSMRFHPGGKGLELSLPSSGTAVAADFDGDHDVDVVLSLLGHSPLLFFERTGDGFRGWHLGEFGDVFGLAAGDYDNDGDLDLYLAAGDVGDPPRDIVRQLAPGRVVFTLGIGKQPADRLDGASFSAGDLELRLSHPPDLSRIHIGRAGRSPESKTLRLTPQEAAGRPRGDGALVWHDGVWHLELAGDEVLSFKGEIRALGDAPEWGLEGHDLEVGSLAPAYRNHLLRNEGRRRFADVTEEAGLEDERSGRAAAWLDADNDGDLDLFLVNSGHNLLGDEPDVLFLNHRASHAASPRFTPLELPAVPAGRGDSVLPFDADGDGALDLVVTNGYGSRPNTPGSVQFLRGVTRANWVEVRLAGSGPGGVNRPAIGAELRLTTEKGGTQHRQVVGGNSIFRSAQSLTQHFGLGSAESARLDVLWPDGRRSRHQLRTGRLYSLRGR